MDPHCVWALRNEGTARHAYSPAAATCHASDLRPRGRTGPVRGNLHTRTPAAPGLAPAASRARAAPASGARSKRKTEQGPPAGAGLRAHGHGAEQVRTPYSLPLPSPMPCGADQCCWQASFPMTAAGQLRNGRARGAPSPDSRLIHRFIWMKRWNHDGRTLRASCRARQGGSRIGRANEKAPFGASSSRSYLTARLPLPLSPRRSGRPAPDGPA